MNEYPMHDKLRAVRDQSQQLGEFLEWLTNETGVVLGQYSEPDPPWDQHLYPCRKRHEEWLAEYFGIDLKVLEQEKRQMLDEIRSKQEEGS